MDFGETPAARVDTRKPRLGDFVGRAIRIHRAERKSSRDGNLYWSLDFDVMIKLDGGEARKVRYTSITTSAYAIDQQLMRLVGENGRLLPQYIPLETRLLLDGRSLMLGPLEPKAQDQKPAPPAQEASE